MHRIIQLPRDIYIGKNLIEKVAELTEGYHSILLATGPKTKDLVGKRIGKLVECEEVIVESPTIEEVHKVENMIRTNQIDVVIGAGGGKIIDVSKLAAFETNIEFISVPTTCSHDGICSPQASIKEDNGAQSINARAPIGVIIDLNIISGAPYKMIAAGVGDTIAKYSAVRDWKLGHVIKGEGFGDYASSLSLMVAEVVMGSILEIKERTDKGMNVLLEALVSSGAAMAIAGSSRPASGSEHKFSHALDMVADYPALHGEQCGIGTIIMSYLQGEDWKRIKNALKLAGCPTTGKEIGVDADQLLEALLKAREIKPERYTIIEHVKLDKEIAEKALNITGVI